MTVTHPDIRRFFMLIPEAVQLVLHAATLGEAGEVIVLDMGEQIKVLDVARHLIRLSGFVPGRGHADRLHRACGRARNSTRNCKGPPKTAEPCGIEKITRIRRQSLPDWPILERDILDLIRLSRRGRTEDVLTRLHRIVPTYQARHPGPRHSRPSGRRHFDITCFLSASRLGDEP